MRIFIIYYLIKLIEVDFLMELLSFPVGSLQYHELYASVCLIEVLCCH